MWLDILFALTVHYQIGGSGFCHWRVVTRGRVLSSLRHGTKHNALSRLKLSKWLPQHVEKLMILNKQQKVIPLISREISFGQNVSELFFGVNIFDLDFRFQVDSVNQPTKSNSVTHVSSWDFVL